jgi:hypothetical protein
MRYVVFVLLNVRAIVPSIAAWVYAGEYHRHVRIGYVEFVLSILAGGSLV